MEEGFCISQLHMFALANALDLDTHVHKVSKSCISILKHMALVYHSWNLSFNQKHNSNLFASLETGITQESVLSSEA